MGLGALWCSCSERAESSASPWGGQAAQRGAAGAEQQGWGVVRVLGRGREGGGGRQSGHAVPKVGLNPKWGFPWSFGVHDMQSVIYARVLQGSWVCCCTKLLQNSLVLSLST